MSVVYIVQMDERKNFSAAKKFGELKAVYSSISRNFSPAAAVRAARETLKNYNPEDSILLTGDPSLCSICVAVASEYSDTVSVLRWDKRILSYTKMIIPFE